MRIGLVAQEFFSGGGGIATQTQVKSAQLSKRGHDVLVFTCQSASSRSASTCSDETRVVVPQPIAMEDSTEELRWLANSLTIARSLELYSFDLIDFAEYGGEAYCHLLNRTEWNHIPVTIQLHGPLAMLTRTIGWPEESSRLHRVGTHMEEMSLRLADAVYSSSRCTAKWCEREYGLDISDVPILHTGVDTEIFKPGLCPKDERPTVLFVARIDKSKGVEIVVEACLDIANEFPDLRLQLYGRDNPQLRKALQERATEAGLPDLVEFKGVISRAELPEKLCRAHVFAVPSFYEGGPGFVYLEAMACGLPVIGCRGSGLDEVIEHGETGLLVQPGSVQEVATTIRNLLLDSTLRASLGERAREWAVRSVDTRDCVARLEDFYQGVIERFRI